MASLTTRRPTITVARKDLEFTVRLDTPDGEEIREGDTFFFVVTGGLDNVSVEQTVQVVRTNSMTLGTTRKWTLTLRYA